MHEQGYTVKDFTLLPLSLRIGKAVRRRLQE
jgi:hypothetical protein